jgi:hypothetical protein
MTSIACRLHAGFSLLALTPASLFADAIPLSSLLGAPSGQAATIANPPFTTFVDLPPYGLGVNCPGSWSSVPIRFVDTEALAHGIGQHPSESGESRVDFDLRAIQRATGRRVESFTARIGIERETSAVDNGATFLVRLDGVAVFTQSVAGRSSPSVPIAVSVRDAGVLTLTTTRQGAFNSNHACWGLAELTLGAPICPVDFNLDGFLDFFDFDDYVQCFEGTACPPGADADFNGDEFVDFFDYDDFVGAFESGC